MDLNDNDNDNVTLMITIIDLLIMMAICKILLLILSFRVWGPKQLKNKQDKLRKYPPILEIPKRSFFPYISFRSSPKLISFPSYAVSQT